MAIRAALTFSSVYFEQNAKKLILDKYGNECEKFFKYFEKNWIIKKS